MTPKYFPSIVVAAFLLFAGAATAQQYKYPFQNPNLPIEQRVNNILSLMTVDEKLAALSRFPMSPGLELPGHRTSRDCMELR